MNPRNIQRKASPVLGIGAGNAEPATLERGHQKSFREAVAAAEARLGCKEPNLRLGYERRQALKAQVHSVTSRAAASAAEPRAGTTRAKVLAFIRRAGIRGATDEEIQRALRMNGNTARPRRIELVERGLVVDSQQVRRTSFKCPAVVWVAVPMSEL